MGNNIEMKCKYKILNFMSFGMCNACGVGCAYRAVGS